MPPPDKGDGGILFPVRTLKLVNVHMLAKEFENLRHLGMLWSIELKSSMKIHTSSQSIRL